MSTHEIFRKRRSIRSFEPRDIPRDIVEQIIDCGRMAPTARNVQPWEFVIITNKDTLKKLASLAENSRCIGESPCCIAVFCDDTKYYLEDGSAATTQILLAAAELGVGSCWIAGDKKDYAETVKNILGAPAQHKLVSLIPLGFPRSQPSAAPPKRSLTEVLHWEKF